MAKYLGYIYINILYIYIFLSLNNKIFNHEITDKAMRCRPTPAKP